MDKKFLIFKHYCNLLQLLNDKNGQHKDKCFINTSKKPRKFIITSYASLFHASSSSVEIKSSLLQSLNSFAERVELPTNTSVINVLTQDITVQVIRYYTNIA